MSPKRLILVLQASTAVLSASYGVMFTMLDDYRDKYGIAESGLGLVVAMGFFASFVSQILIAPMADRGFAKRLLVVGFSLAVIGSIGMAFGGTLSALLISRTVMGIGTGMALPALRRIVIVSDPEHLGTNVGRMLSVDVGGFAAGPIISALTVDTLGIAAPFVIIAVILVVMSALLARVQVPETREEDRPTERLAFDLLRIPAVAGAVLLGVALFVMIGTFDSLWSLMMDDLEAPTWMANAGVSLFALPMIVLGPRGGRLSQARGPYKMGAIGMTVGLVCMCGYGLLASPYVMFAVLCLHMLNDGLTVTSAGIAVGMAAPQERQAGAQGLLGGIQTLVGGIVATMAGWCYDTFGRGTTFVGSAAVMLVLVILGLWLAGPYRWSTPPTEMTAGDGDTTSGDLAPTA